MPVIVPLRLNLDGTQSPIRLRAYLDDQIATQNVDCLIPDALFKPTNPFAVIDDVAVKGGPLVPEFEPRHVHKGLPVQVIIGSTKASGIKAKLVIVLFKQAIKGFLATLQGSSDQNCVGI